MNGCKNKVMFRCMKHDFNYIKISKKMGKIKIKKKIKKYLKNVLTINI